MTSQRHSSFLIRCALLAGPLAAADGDPDGGFFAEGRVDLGTKGSDAEVEQFHLTLAVDQDVRGLEIAVHHEVGMRVRHRLGELAVAHTLNNLALAHEQPGDYAGARASHQRALAVRRRILAPDHPDIAESLNNLGNVLRLSGDLPAAREAFRTALAIRRSALGPSHPYVATTLHNLGITLSALGDAAGARPLLESAGADCRARGRHRRRR